MYCVLVKNPNKDIFRCTYKYVVELFYDNIFLYFGTFTDGLYLAKELNDYYKTNNIKLEERVVQHIYVSLFIYVNFSLAYELDCHFIFLTFKI